MQSILFVDQVGSTRLVAKIGNESMLAMRVQLWDIINTTVGRHHGRVFSDEGDGGAVAFPTAADAAQAAIEMLDATSAGDIEIRIGVHTGEVVANGDGFVGLAVHIAARLCDEAPHNHAVVSTATAAALGDTPFVTTAFGQRAVKGLDEPIQVSLLTPRPLTSDHVEALAAKPGWEPLPSSGLLETRTEHIVGRGDTRDLLLKRAARAHAGSVEVVLVAGNPGAGKSSIVNATALELATSGSLCLLGRADEAFDNPFNEIVEMFTHVIAHAPSALLAEHVLRHGDLLTRLLPGLADRVPSASRWSDEPTDSVPDRGLLFDAVADLLRSLARHQPIVLIFEDVHWASTQTLDLIRHLVRSKDMGPVLILVTYRPTDTANNANAAQFIDFARTDVGSTTINLDPLRPEHVAELVRVRMPEVASTRHDLIEPLAAFVHQQTGGNALFCTEVLRGLETGGLVHDDTWTELQVDELLARVQIPSTVQDLARLRAERLGADVVAVLTDAAVLGESFAAVELLALHTTGDVLAALDRAENDSLVRAEDPAGRRYSFSHSLVQMALYGRLATSERLRRHHGAAKVILSLPDRGADALRHFQAAGVLASPAEVAAAARRAADEALDRLALSEAMTFRHVAADAALEDPHSSPTARARALAALGRAQTAVGLLAGKTTMVAAADQARLADDWDLFGEIAADYGGDLKENQAVFAVAEPIELIEEALAKQPEPTALRARLLVSLALWKRQNTPYGDRRPLVDEAMVIARSLPEPFALATVLASHHRALHGPNVTEESMANADELERLAIKRADDGMRFQALNVRLMVAVASGQWPLAQHTQSQLREVGALLQNIEGQRLALMWDAFTHALQGEFDDAFAMVERCEELLVGYPAEDLGRFVAALTFIPLWLQGKSGVLYEITLRAHHRESSIAWFAADSGQTELAATAIAASGGIAQSEAQMDYMWWHDVVGLTRAARATNDTATASQVYESAIRYRSHNATMGLVSFLGAVEHHLGTLAMVRGQIDTAIEHFELGLTRHRDMGARPFVALTAAELAQALESRGAEQDAARATALRSEAAALADELNLGLVQQVLDAHRGER